MYFVRDFNYARAQTNGSAENLLHFSNTQADLVKSLNESSFCLHGSILNGSFDLLDADLLDADVLDADLI